MLQSQGDVIKAQMEVHICKNTLSYFKYFSLKKYHC